MISLASVCYRLPLNIQRGCRSYSTKEMGFLDRARWPVLIKEISDLHTKLVDANHKFRSAVTKSEQIATEVIREISKRKEDKEFINILENMHPEERNYLIQKMQNNSDSPVWKSRFDLSLLQVFAASKAAENIAAELRAKVFEYAVIHKGGIDLLSGQLFKNQWEQLKFKDSIYLMLEEQSTVSNNMLKLITKEEN